MADFVGTPGNDTLNGTSGADRMTGLGGNDTYIVNHVGDVVIESNGGGTDIIYSALSYRLNDNSEVENLSTISWQALDALSLYGNMLANNLIGNAGANLLDGGGGNDIMTGREGNDTYLVDSAGDRPVEAAGQGTDIVYSSVSYTLASNSEVENLSTISWDATTAINLTGNGLANALIGNAGANHLDGGAGADTMTGREGNDTYYVDNAGDRPMEAAGQGTDIVYTSVSYTLASNTNVENLSTILWQATDAINLTGNGLANALIGNAGANQLNGGAGADTMTGREGNDTYYVDNAADRAVEAAGQGIDIVYTSVSYTLASNTDVENLSTILWQATDAINLTGNALANALIGNAGANQLNGAGGADTMTGREGNDTYYVDNAADRAVEAAGQGTDIVYTSVSYTLASNSDVENLSTILWQATDAINLTGNGLANTLFGNAGANQLNGGAGADTLDGKGGADSFAFTTALGAGNVDVIVGFSVADDTIRLGGGAGEPFAALASGALAASAFVIGTAAADATDMLIYNSATGALLYDADGSGGAAAVQFARLSTGLSLTAADFFIAGPTNNAPVITSPTSVSVAENSPVGNVVYATAASDADGDRITYALAGDDAALLTIDAAGRVRLKAAADFETRSTYEFSVIASDSGLVPAVRDVTLHVTNVAEDTPIILETGGANDGTATAQSIDRAVLAASTNINLFNDDLPSATIQGNVSGVADRDFFKIVLQAGERLILDVDGTQGGLDSHLRIFGPGGNEIASNDDQEIFDQGSVPTIGGHNTDSLFSFRAPSAGTYFFSIEGFDSESAGSYQLHVSVGPPASLAEIINEDVDALVSGLEWAGNSLSYAFPTSVSQYPADIDETTPASDFAPFTAVQQQATTQLLQLVANVSGLSFQLASNPAAAHLKFAMSSDADPAFAYYPSSGNPTPGSTLAGTAWFNKQDFNNPVKGNYAWMAMLHETGHALGLKHGHETPTAISPDRDSLEYSVMTYRSYVGQGVGPNDGFGNETFGYPQTLMMLDIAALQRIYGANFSHNATDTVYRWSSTTGEMSINGAGQGAPGANRVFMTLWDGGGTDTYDLSTYSSNLTIDLRPGEWTRLGGVQLANLGDGNSARGNVANALLFEGDTRSLIENAIGGNGVDTLVGNRAKNMLTGNGGPDQFSWHSIEDAGLGAQADVITDFAREPEHINLEGIDAVSTVAGDQAFSFIGSNAFSNIAGQLRTQVEGNSIRVQGDVNGDSVADFELVVANQTLLFHSDFFL